MRIAILVSGLPPEHNGGTEIATMALAECATRIGHDIHIIYPSQQDRVDIQKVHTHRVRVAPAKYLHTVTCLPDIIKIVTEVKPDLIHAQGVYFALSALVASKLTRTPYLFSERGSVHVYVPLKSLVYKTILNQATRIIAQTAYQKDILSRYTTKSIEVIPNGVSISKFGNAQKSDARSVLGLPDDGHLILSVGRCRPEKNLADFVRAALSDSKRDRTYVLIGDGAELESLKNKAHGASNIRFEGNVPNYCIPLWMSAADVLVNTSLSEGFPVTILEAMASGLPVVAPRICGIPEIVEDGANGFLSESCDYRSTAWLVDFLIDNPLIRSKISEVNRLTARRYTWESVVRKLYG